MTYTISDGLRDREYAKFASTGSETAVRVELYAMSGTVWLPIKCLSDGTLLTSGA
jgi:hypothetical protein